MATYYDIFGQKVQYFSSDPSDLVEGQVWYNAPAKVGKVQSYNAAVAWSSGGTMNTARGGFYGGAGAGVNDGLIGGSNPTAVEQYNGTSWTTKTSPSDGTTQRTWWGDSSSAAGQVMGYPYSNTEEWDGSSWTAGGSFPTNIYTGHAVGSLTDAIYWGGFDSSPNLSSMSAVYNGTTWTNSPNTPTAAGYSGGGLGTGAAALGYGGYTGGPTIQITTAYEWNDTSWSNTNSCNTRVQYGDGFGIQTAGVKVGGGQPPGNPNAPNSTELYDGTSFTISPGQLNNARGGGAGSGVTNANAFYAGGGAAPLQNTTEEWAGIGVATKTITAS